MKFSQDSRANSIVAGIGGLLLIIIAVILFTLISAALGGVIGLGVAYAYHTLLGWTAVSYELAAFLGSLLALMASGSASASA